MTGQQSELNTLYSLAAQVKQAASEALGARPEDGAELMEQIARLAAQMETRLARSGAAAPAALPARFEVPLHMLDTPANRRYARALRAAWEAGLEVDRERYGDTIGTDGAAQVIEMVLADVEEELHGPVGLVPE